MVDITHPSVSWIETLETLLRHKWFDPARLFLVFALPLAALYIYQWGDASRFPHNKGRFLHSVHLALSLTGEGQNMPESFIDTLSRIKPFPNSSMAGNACHWQPELNAKYCHAFAPDYQNPSFSEMAKIPLEPDKTLPFSSYIFAAQYPFAGYIFYALGAGIGLLFQLPPIIIFYLSLSVNALTVIILEYVALRLLPVFRWPMVYLLLLPSSFITRTQFMPDAFVQAIGVLIVAIALCLLYKPIRLTPWQIAGLVALGILSGFIKLAYMWMPMLFALIPNTCFSSRRIKWTVVLSTLALSVAAAVSWAAYATATLYPWELTTNAAHATSSVMRHIAETFLQPLTYISAVIATLFSQKQLWLTMGEIITGRQWWWLWLWHMPLLIYFLPLLMLTLPIERDDIVYKLWQRLLGIFIFFATWLVLCVLMHFHRPGTLAYAPSLVQGRYLLPVLPSLAFSFYSLIALPNSFKTLYQAVSIELMFMAITGLNSAQLIAN